jgi:hypothetical protein
MSRGYHLSMRALLAAALAVLAVVVAGCGGGGSAGVASGATLGLSAAQLVPTDATAFVSVDSNLSSAQWQRVDDLTKSFPVRAKLIDEINSQLQQKGLSWKDDVAPALGDELDVAAFGSGSNLEYVAFTKPDDAAKLDALAAKLSEGNEKYTVQQIGGWSVVADSQELFDKVRASASGTSLAEAAAFKTAWASVSGDALARAYASGKLVAKADWYAARVAADGDALRLDVTSHEAGSVNASKKQSLLGDLPSGAALGVAFHGSSDLAKALASTNLTTRVPLKQIGPLLTGDGALYVRASGLVPDFAIELTPKDPQAALAAARALIRNLRGSLSMLPLSAQLSGRKVVISDGPAAAAALRSGAKLVDDSAYKDAVAAAGVPAQTTYVAYANVTELAPFIQILAQSLGNKMLTETLSTNLPHVGTVVAWGTAGGSTARLHLWIQPK